MLKRLTITASLLCGLVLNSQAIAADKNYVFKAGHSSLKEWRLPSAVPYPRDNKPNTARIELGKMLFFDPRLSGDGNMSCASCHNPVLGWSDGLPTAKGFKSQILGRASPTIINTAYNQIQMWDGRKASLEDQAMGPMEATVEMNMDTDRLFKWLNKNETYRNAFAAAYPGKAINADTVSKAIASFERTVVSRNSRFDRWLRGDKRAMNEQEVRGFRLFVGRAKCADCHSAPNFTDDGFHNIGLKSFGDSNPDMGRYAQRPVKLMKGAFKTPTLRDITRTGPYFHDGSAKTLEEVIDHYSEGGVVKDNLSPNMKKLELCISEKEDLLAFLQTLTSPYVHISLPKLPPN